MENSGLAAFLSGLAGASFISSVLIINTAECQSKALLDRMQGQQFCKRKTCTIQVAKRTYYPCLAGIRVVHNAALYRDVLPLLPIFVLLLWNE